MTPTAQETSLPRPRKVPNPHLGGGTRSSSTQNSDATLIGRGGCTAALLIPPGSFRFPWGAPSAAGGADTCPSWGTLKTWQHDLSPAFHSETSFWPAATYISGRAEGFGRVWVSSGFRVWGANPGRTGARASMGQASGCCHECTGIWKRRSHSCGKRTG